MNTDTDTLINVIRDRMLNMTDEQRLDLIKDITESYCVNCGGDIALATVKMTNRNITQS